MTWAYQYPSLIKREGHKDKGNDHQLKQLLIEKQVLLSSISRKVWRTVRRICILLLDREWSIHWVMVHKISTYFTASGSVVSFFSQTFFYLKFSFFYTYNWCFEHKSLFTLLNGFSQESTLTQIKIRHLMSEPCCFLLLICF